MVPYPVIRGRLLGERRLLVGPRVLEPVGRPRGRRTRTSSPARRPAASRRSILASTRTTGRANFDVDSYVAQAVDGRALPHRGPVLATQRGVSIVFPDQPWRADWVTSGLYHDGWTQPGHARRASGFFARRGQTRPRCDTLRVTSRRARRTSHAPGHVPLEHGNVALAVTSGTGVQLQASPCASRARGSPDVTLAAPGCLAASTATRRTVDRRFGAAAHRAACSSGRSRSTGSASGATLRAQSLKTASSSRSASGDRSSVRDRAGDADRLAQLLEIARAPAAAVDVLLEAPQVGRRERSLEVVGDELDELLAAECFGVGHHSSGAR